MKANKIEKIIGTGLLSGYFPIFPGTAGSVVAVIIYFIPGFENPTVMLIAISLFTIIGINIATKFEAEYGKDPSIFTLDEFIGTWISLLFIPKILWLIILDFIVWRLLDIIKPFPAKQLENIKGGTGVIADDVVSGIYSLIIMHIFIFLLL